MIHYRIMRMSGINKLHIIQKLDLFSEKLEKNTRKQEVVSRKHLLASLYVYFGKSNLNDIGVKLGYKTHSTVVHACKKLKYYLDCNDTEINKAYNQLIIDFDNVDIPTLDDIHKYLQKRYEY